MLVKAKIPFTLSLDGALTSVAKDQVVEVTTTVGNGLVSAGLAEAGTTTYTKNGNYNGGKIVVAVVTATITYNANGGTGTVDPQVVAAGSVATLNNGAGLTAPAGKAFDGWATDASATKGKTSMTISEDTTVYAIWKNA